jgi:hypothetical protein
VLQYRAAGPQQSALPPLSPSAIVCVHPSYADALNLQNVLISSLQESVELRTSGLLVDIPEAINLEEYQQKLTILQEELKTLPRGEAHAGRYEALIGDVIRLCFFRSLTNVQPHVRDIDGRIVRDWIAANHSTGGFWELVRLRYEATQIVWECKNYDDLGADAFHQAAYYMSKQIGRFVVLSFRGEIKSHYYEHIRRISTDKDGGLVLLLTDKDISVFIRQAIKGKNREQHIQEQFDKTVRMVS